jgi:AbrB family looped-hinge helix DNA binding protein
MTNIATTKMSSKGQVVIPEAVRQKLKLDSGSQFVVMAENDAIILKLITPPDMSQFSELVKKVRKQVKAAGITPADLKKAIKETRRKK